MAVLFALSATWSTQAQVVVYNIGNQVVNGGNPRGLNTDVDNIAHTTANGFTELLTSGLSTPTFSQPQALPIPFQFNGTTVTHFLVSPTGVLTFDTTLKGGFTSPVNGRLNTTSFPNNSIAGYWENFTFTPPTPATSKVYGKVYGTAPNRQYWVDWFGFSIGGATNAHFSVVLEETTNKIYIVDKNLWSGSNVTASVGIKIDNTKFYEGTGTPSIAFGTGTSATSDNDYWEVTPTPISTYLQTVGTGTTTNTGTTHPTPYAAATWGARLQMLILKSEMPGLDTTPILKSMAFDVVTAKGNPLGNFTIKLKNTTASSLTSFESGMTTVFNTASYTEVAGWNTHIFDTPFQWDTTQNLLVEICFNNNTAVANGNAIVNSTVTPFVSTLVNASNTTGICASNSITGTFSLRPNMQLNGLAPYIDLLPPSINITSSLANGCTLAPRNVTATITDNDTVISASLKYSFDNGATYTSINMTKGSGNSWSATIPAASAGQMVMFYITATDRSNNSNAQDIKSYRDQYLYVNLGPDQAITLGNSITLGPNGGVLPQPELKITEIVYNAVTGRGAQLASTVPAYLPWVDFQTDYIEIQNTGIVPINMNGMQLASYGTAGGPGGGAANYTYTFPSVVMNPGDIAVVISGTGTDSAAVRKFYSGSGNNPYTSTGQWGIAIKNGSKIVDAMAFNGYTFTTASGVTAADWTGTITGINGRAGVYRTYVDKNDNTDWAISDTLAGTNRTSIGVTNPGLVLNNDTNRYQWRALPSATVIDSSKYITVAPNVTTSYTLTVRDNVCSYTDTIVVNIITYCAPASRNDSVYIGRVQLWNIDTTSNYSPNGYSLNVAKTTTLVKGSTSNYVRVTPMYTGATRPTYSKAWIDWNKDGDFNDAGEEIHSAGPSTSAQQSMFSVPSAVANGSTRMRVAMQADSMPTVCDTLYSGEFEDYNVTIVDPANDVDAPTVVSVDQASSGCSPVAKTIGAVISDNYGVDSATLYYSFNGGTYSSVAMAYNAATGKWSGVIPAAPANQTVLYYVSAKDFKGNTSTNSKTNKYTDGIASIYGGTDTIVAPNGRVVRIAKTSRTTTLISEVLVNRGQPGTQTAFPAYLPQNGNADMVEITNLGGYTNQLGLCSLLVYATGFGPGQTYTKALPAGTTLAPGRSIVFVGGNGADDAANGIFYLGGNFGDIINSFGTSGIAFVDSSGNPIDAIAFNNYAFTNPKITAGDWSGTLTVPQNGLAGYLRRGTSDHNDATDWNAASAAATTSIGTLNSGLTGPNATIVWKVAGSSTNVSSNDTLNVTVGATTRYVAVLTIDSCSSTDTVVVTVDSSLVNMTALSVTNSTAPCAMTSSETLVFAAKNNGASTIDYSTKALNVTVKVFNGTTTATYNASKTTGTTPVGDTVYVSVTGVNMSPGANGTTYSISAYLSVNGDQVAADDTTHNSYRSERIALSAGADQTVPLGSSATLTATSNYKNVVISEIMQSTATQGAQNNYPTGYPAAGTQVDMVELTNLSPLDISIEGWTLNFFGTTQVPDYSFTFPAGAVIPGNTVVGYVSGTGASSIANRVYYRYASGNNTNNTVNAGDAMGVVLRDSTGTIRDVAATNSYVFTAASGVTSADWSGNAPNTPANPGIQRIGVDRNLGSDFAATNLQRTSTMGTLNTGLTSPIGSISWAAVGGSSVGTTATVSVTPNATTNYVATLVAGACSITDTVKVIVDSNLVDVHAMTVGTNRPACALTSSDTVYMKIKNTGAVALNFATRNMAVSLYVNNSMVSSRTINTGNLPVGDSTFILFTGINLSTTPGTNTTYVLHGIAKVTGDGISANDTTGKTRVVSEGLSVNAGTDQTIVSGSRTNLRATTSGRVVFTEWISATTGVTGLQTPAPAIPGWGAAGPDFLEISNTGTTPVDISGYVFHSYVNNGRPGQRNFTYTFPSGTVLNGGSALLLSTDTGTSTGTIHFMGITPNDQYNTGGTFGFVLRSPAGDLVDAFAVNGFNFTAAMNVPTTAWSGTIGNSTGRAGVQRFVDDTNTAGDWQIDSTGRVSTAGVMPLMSPTYIKWFSSTSVQVGSHDTLTVWPTSTTYYVASYSNGTCTVFDTVNITISTNITDVAALYPTVLGTPCSYGAAEVAELILKNTGTNPINMATTPIVGTLYVGATPYTFQVNTGTANAGDTIRVRVNNVDLSAVGAGVARLYFTFVMTGDANIGNNVSDSLFVRNRNNTVTAIATPYTINYGSTTVLRASAPSALKFTEYIPCANNATCRGFQDTTTVPTGIPFNFNTELIEITNTGFGVADLTGMTMQSYVNGGGPGAAGNYTYNLPAITLQPGQVLVLATGTGTSIPASRIYYMGLGGNNPYQSGTQVGLVMRSGTSIVDVFAANGYTFNAASGVTAADWSGTIAVNGRAGAFRRNDDNNLASDWLATDTIVGRTTTIGVLNPGNTVPVPLYKWYNSNGVLVGIGDTLIVRPIDTTTYQVSLRYSSCTAYDTVRVNVIPRSFNDLQAVTILNSNSAPYNTPIAIQATVKNNGAPVSMFYMGMLVNGNLYVTDTVRMPSKLYSDSTYTHTFSRLWQPTTTVTSQICALVSVAADNTSSNDSTCKSFYSSVGTKNITKEELLSIYPNPASENINLQWSMDGKVQVSIVDLTGRTIRTVVVSNSTKTTQLNIADLAEGTYVIRFRSGDQVLTRKFVKTN